MNKNELIASLEGRIIGGEMHGGGYIHVPQDEAEAVLGLLKAQEPDTSKYQYKIDHTDCIWYSDGDNRCPSTCSQYRDGWNDAMDFIFKNGCGYQPYKRR